MLTIAQDADLPVLELKDDAPLALYGLIADLYGAEIFANTGEPDNRRRNFACDEDGAGFVKYQVNLYVTADKYLVPGLCSRIADDFPGMLGAIKSERGYPSFVDAVARHIYGDCAGAATELRSSVTTLLALDIKSLKTHEEFKALLSDLPELAFELILTLAGED